MQHSFPKQKGLQPHSLHIGIVLSSEELVTPVCPHNILIHCELNSSPEIFLSIRAHGDSVIKKEKRGGKDLKTVYFALPLVKQ